MPVPTPADARSIAIFDPLRTLAAGAVGAGHLSNPLNFQLPVFSSAAFAVDIFMNISGFLMLYHYAGRGGPRAHYAQPSILPLKIEVFALGMVAAGVLLFGGSTKASDVPVDALGFIAFHGAVLLALNAIGAICHRLIENPGIGLGRRILEARLVSPSPHSA